MISRRGFLESLFGTAVAVLVLTKLDPLIAKSPDVVAHIVKDDPAWGMTFDAALKEARRMFDAAWMAERDTLYEMTDQELWHQQLNVAFYSYSDRVEQPMTIQPAMTCLAVSAVDDGLGRFGRLALPVGTEYAKLSGPLRMVVAYDVMVDRYITRFDVRGEQTPEAARLARVRSETRLKNQIRHRLQRLSVTGAACNPFYLR